MSEVEKLEQELKKLKTKSKSSLITVFKDTMSLGLSELSKTVSFIFAVPKSGKNQISKELEDWENEVISNRSVK